MVFSIQYGSIPTPPPTQNATTDLTVVVERCNAMTVGTVTISVIALPSETLHICMDFQSNPIRVK